MCLLFNFRSRTWFAVPTARKCPFFVCVICCVCFFPFLHMKYVHLVQRLLLYPDDRGSTGCPPQFPPQDIFAELRWVHSSPTRAHDFKSSLLQPLEDLRGAKTSIQLGERYALWPHSQPIELSQSLRSYAAPVKLIRPLSLLSAFKWRVEREGANISNT